LPQNRNSRLFEVGFRVRGIPDSIDKEAVYVPLDGTVSYDTINDFFQEEIAKKRDLDPGDVQLIISRDTEEPIYRDN
jgi:hypothetical protein